MTQAKINRTDKRPERRKLLTVVCHALIILIIFILPEMMMRMAWARPEMSVPWGVYAKSGVIICVFYLNYFVLVDRKLIHKHHLWQFILLNVIVIAVALGIMQYIGRYGMPHRHHHHEPDQWRMMLATASIVMRDGIMLILTISLALALRMSSRWFDMERRRQQLATAKRESELAGLRTQLNPHFLFNTLNSIYTLIQIDRQSAASAVHELSQLLRYVVYENPSEVDVHREVDFVTSYISLMQLRMSDQEVQFTTELSPDAPQIAPLLFITLIENSFKHGMHIHGEPIRIFIRANAREVECSTENTFNPDTRTDKGSGGVGLTNLRRRLELLYGQRASLDTEIRDNKFFAQIKIINE